MGDVGASVKVLYFHLLSKKPFLQLLRFNQSNFNYAMLVEQGQVQHFFFLLN